MQNIITLMFHNLISKISKKPRAYYIVPKLKTTHAIDNHEF